MNIGSEILEELGKPAQYERPSSGVSTITAIIRDRGARSRVGRGVVLTSDAVATVSDSVVFERNATLTFEGTVYRVESKEQGSPGSNVWSLSRLSGDRIESTDSFFGDDIVDAFGDDVIVYNSQSIPAHVVRTATRTEMKKSGAIVNVVKTVATIRISDAPDIKPKDQIELDGRTYTVRETNRTGFGLVDLELDK
jgi:hypothetical protein